MRFRFGVLLPLIITFCFLLHEGALAADRIIVEVDQLRRPPEEFLEHGDVIGISKTLLDRMNIKEGDEVLVKTPAGGIFAFRTKIHGNYEDRIYAKKTLRETMGAIDGNIRLLLTPAVWGNGPAEPMTANFTEVSRPPKAFLDFGDSVGVSTQVLLEANIPPGWKGTLTGPMGSVEVTIQLLDRGNATISMKQTLREAIGVEDGPANVSLTIHARPKTASDADQSQENEQAEEN